jgi:hypothetical protein
MSTYLTTLEFVKKDLQALVKPPALIISLSSVKLEPEQVEAYSTDIMETKKKKVVVTLSKLAGTVFIAFALDLSDKLVTVFNPEVTGVYDIQKVKISNLAPLLAYQVKRIKEHTI